MRCQRPHILNMRRRARSEHICRGSGRGRVVHRRVGLGRRLHLFISIHLPTFASYLPGSLTTFEAHFGVCSPLTVHPLSLVVFGKICPMQGNSGTHPPTCLSGANVTLTDRFGGCPHIEGGEGPVLDSFRVQVGRFFSWPPPPPPAKKSPDWNGIGLILNLCDHSGHSHPPRDECPPSFHGLLSFHILEPFSLPYL